MRPLIIMPILALAACQPATTDPRGVDRDETLLTVSATGRAETRPDEARFSLGVDTLAASAREASRMNNEKMQKVTAALRQFGVGEKDLQTQTLTLNRVDYGKDRGRFSANNRVEVRLRDLGRVSEAITAATEAGANLMRGPSLAVSDREAANKSAYAEAYRAARTRATYAEAAGLKVSRVLTIRDGGTGGGWPDPAMMDTMAVEQAAAPVVAPPPPPFNPGVNRTTVSVTVAFALEGK